jgi:hypothetical protein
VPAKTSRREMALRDTGVALIRVRATIDFMSVFVRGEIAGPHPLEQARPGELFNVSFVNCCVDCPWSSPPLRGRG